MTPDERCKITEIENITANMLGRRMRMKLKTNAMETKCLVSFATQMSLKHSDRLGSIGPILHNAGKALIRFNKTIDVAPQVVEDSMVKELRDLHA